MRVLLLLRGSAGCGKSTWIEKTGLKQFTLSADDIRMLCSSPILTVTGNKAINPSNDTVVWSILFKLLETRMQNGEFTVIDATNSKTSEMNRYKELCSTYKYRIYCVDFTDIPIDVVKERNRNRTELKKVPDEAIEKMYSRFCTQKIPSGIAVIKPNELDKIWLKPIDLSDYKKIHIIGDIHGCCTAYNQYLESCGGFNTDEFYIFCGDYVDRGIENAEMITELLKIYNKKNVCMLEGNHEKWLWVWANDGIAKSIEFELNTKTELENAKISKKDVRQFYRRLGQCAYFNYAGKTYLVTHAGLSTIPQNLTFVSTAQMIRGVGNYNDIEAVSESFLKNTPANCYQIHGHRNTKCLPAKVNDRCFNLEGKVEHGGRLRCLQLFPDGTQHIVEIQNTVYKQIEEQKPSSPQTDKTLADIILELRHNKYVQEKRFGNISSFNFTNSAFYEKVWDEQTTKARGLYINIPKQKVIARAYDKFFNINEHNETKLDMLQYKLSFPVNVYVKENGFLGIVSYNEESDALFITTKSNPEGDYAMWFRAMLEENISAESLDEMKKFARDNNVSFVFECVDMQHDPHIIDYHTNRLYLLDVVYNEIEFKKYSFDKLCIIADKFGLSHKEMAFKIDSWQEFFDWYYDVIQSGYLYNGRNIEGFVIEDSNGYMIKLKLAYYNFWKYMRAISNESIRKGYIDSRKTSSLTTPLANQYYGWVRTLHTDNKDENTPRDICTLRRLFFETETGKQFATTAD